MFLCFPPFVWCECSSVWAHSPRVIFRYGDCSDPMSDCANLPRFNAVHRYQQGWLLAANVISNPSGDFTLMSSSVCGVSAPCVCLIRVTRPHLSGAYYISFRTPVGFDSSLGSTSSYVTTISLHRWASGNTLLVAQISPGTWFKLVVAALDPVVVVVSFHLFSDVISLSRTYLAATRLTTGRCTWTA